MSNAAVTCSELDVNKTTDDEIAEFVNSFDTVMTDCDGVLWKAKGAIEGSPELIQKFRQLGKKIFFVTNNSTKTREEYVRKCADLGFDGDKDEILGDGLYGRQLSSERKIPG